MITEAETDTERQEVLDLFLGEFADIEPNAVPMTCDDWVYKTIVAQYHEQATGRLLGAALTCSHQLAAGAATAATMNLPLPPHADYASVLDRHSALDLLIVRPESRGRGIGQHTRLASPLVGSPAIKNPVDLNGHH